MKVLNSLLIFILFICIINCQEYTKFLYEGGCLGKDEFVLSDLKDCYNFCKDNTGLSNSTVITDHVIGVKGDPEYTIISYAKDKCHQDLLYYQQLNCSSDKSEISNRNGMTVQCLKNNQYVFNSVEVKSSKCSQVVNIYNCTKSCNDDGYFKFTIMNEFTNQYIFGRYSDDQCSMDKYIDGGNVYCLLNFGFGDYSVYCKGYPNGFNSNDSSSGNSNTDSENSNSSTGNNSSTDPVDSSSTISYSALLILSLVIFNLL